MLVYHSVSKFHWKELETTNLRLVAKAVIHLFRMHSHLRYPFITTCDNVTSWISTSVLYQ